MSAIFGIASPPLSGHTFAWLKDARWQVGVILASIVFLAVLSWIVPTSDVQTHNILHHLNFIPLTMAGMLFGWRIAGFCTLFAIAAHSVHIWRAWVPAPFEATDQVIELSIFGMAGIVTGFLSDRERGQRRNLEKTKRELEHVYQELQQNIEQLKKAERLYAAGQLSASLAHEIRNPLASISGAAGILKRGHASSENVGECLEIIEKESQRLNKLLTNFLDFARPRAPRFQRTELKTVIDSVASMAVHATNLNNVEIRREVGLLPDVECDPEQIKQVLLNLLINAVQASYAGGVVLLQASAKENRVWITVRDEGAGIEPELFHRIFDPFFTTKETGSGLGLAIAANIMEQHGGRLEAENNQDRGMTFRLELPLDRSRS